MTDLIHLNQIHMGANDFKPLTDDSEMPFGIHKGTKMSDVPAQYLLWMYDTYMQSDESSHNGSRVVSYVLVNKEKIEKRALTETKK